MSSIQNICKWCKFGWHRHGKCSTWYYTQDQLIGHGNCSDVFWNSNPIAIPSMQSISEDLQYWTNGFSLKTDVYLQKLAILIFNCYPWQLKYWTVSTMCNLVTAYERFNDSLTTTYWQHHDNISLTLASALVDEIFMRAGDSWATASWQISWDLDGNCISACVSFV